MKKLFVLTIVTASLLFASSAYSQVYINAGIGFRGPRAYVAAAPPVAYPNGYGYGYGPAVYENEFPGYVYYNYPAWNGHYRDRFYYEHYRPYFERSYRGYFRGRSFDHARYEHDHGGRGGWGHGRHW